MVKTKGFNIMNNQTHWKTFEQMEEGKKYVAFWAKESMCLTDLYERQGDKIVFKSKHDETYYTSKHSDNKENVLFTEAPNQSNVSPQNKENLTINMNNTDVNKLKKYMGIESTTQDTNLKIYW